MKRDQKLQIVFVQKWNMPQNTCRIMQWVMILQIEEGWMQIQSTLLQFVLTKNLNAVLSVGISVKISLNTLKFVAVK